MLGLGTWMNMDLDVVWKNYVMDVGSSDPK